WLGAGPANGTRSPRRCKGRSSTRFAGIDPALEGVDLIFRPRAVAGHRPGAHSGEDVVGVSADVVRRPEVEGELHRLQVARPEQRLDVVLKADRLHRFGSFSVGRWGRG